MDMKRRVVVTGLGAITPIGNDVESFWQGLKEKKIGFGPITYFDTTEYKVKVAAQVKDFDAKNYMDPKAARRMEPFSQFAVAAAAQAGIDMEKEDPYRVGTSVGSGIGSLQVMEREHKKMLEKGPSRVNPLLVPLMISNMAVGNVALQFGLKGKSINVVTACATGTNCIGEAFRSIQYGEADVMVVVGGKNSSNTQKLLETCRLRCKRSILVETPEDVPQNLAKADDRVALTAGASTPQWLLEQVRARIEENAK